MRIVGRAFVAFLVAGSMTAGAQAQTRMGTLSMGQSAYGDISFTDAMDGWNSRRYDEWLLQVSGNQPYCVEVVAGFDTMVNLYTTDNAMRTAQRQGGDDDSGGNLNPRYCNEQSYSDTLVVRVQPYRADGTGAYTIRMVPRTRQ